MGLLAEALEPRMMLAGDAVDMSNVSDYAPTGESDYVATPGDANQDGVFDQVDLVQVLEAGKYLTGESAQWHQGDWNGDSLFDHNDIVAALQANSYLESPFAANAANRVTFSFAKSFDQEATDDEGFPTWTGDNGVKAVLKAFEQVGKTTKITEFEFSINDGNGDTVVSALTGTSNPNKGNDQDIVLNGVVTTGTSLIPEGAQVQLRAESGAPIVGIVSFNIQSGNS